MIRVVKDVLRDELRRKAVEALRSFAKHFREVRQERAK